MELWATVLLWMMLFSAACNFWAIVQSSGGVKDSTALALALEVGLVVWAFTVGVTLW